VTRASAHPLKRPRPAAGSDGPKANRFGGFAPQHVELVSKDKDLGFQRNPGPEQSDCPVCYIGELGAVQAVSRNVPNLGPRVTIVDNTGKRISRLGGLGPGLGPTDDVSFLSLG
jgi:hypothetical protein